MTRFSAIFLVAVALFSAGESARGQKKAEPIIGSYRWFNSSEVDFIGNGTVACTFADGKKVPGVWAVNPYGGYVIMWEGGFVDSVKLTVGRNLEGSGVTPDGKLQTITGKRHKK